MTPELQSALIGFCVVLLTVAGGALTAWWDERKKRRYAEGERDEARETTEVVRAAADADRERLFNEFVNDCLKRVTELSAELREVRERMEKQREEHERREREWEAERKRLNQRIEAQGRRIAELEAQLKGSSHGNL